MIARDDDCTFGVLQSRVHECWGLAKCGAHGVGDTPSYNPTVTFATFPFPAGLEPNRPAAEYAADPRAQAIAAAAKKLVELRDRWLNPPEWTERIDEVVPGYPQRIVAKAGHEADLKKRTLTELYNKRPTWLADADKALDAAVLAAYGWPAELEDEEILRRLLALNLARAAGQGGVTTADADEPEEDA